MSAGVAFVSTATEVLDAWQAYKDHVDDVRQRRHALSERFGRHLMVNRLGFGHGTLVVGFQKLDTDKPRDIIGDSGELRVPADKWDSTVVPNVRRKAGKELRDEMGQLSQEGPDLPGMPAFQLVGMRSLAPALFEHNGEVWAFWGEDIDARDNATGGELDEHLWTAKPLSTYYAAKEAYDAKDGAR